MELSGHARGTALWVLTSKLGMLKKQGKNNLWPGPEQPCFPKNCLQIQQESRYYDCRLMTTGLKLKNVV